MDIGRRRTVKPFQPVSQDICPRAGIAALKIHMRHGVRRHGIGGIEREGALRQTHRLIQSAGLVMRPGVFGQKRPVVFTVGGTALQQRQIRRREIGLSNAAAAHGCTADGPAASAGHRGGTRPGVAELRQGLAPLPLYPEVDDRKLLAFPAGNACGARQGTLDTGPGFCRLGALHVPERQTAMGYCQTVVEGDRFFELGVGTSILGQQPVEAFLPSLRRVRLMGADGHTIVVGEGMGHLSTSLTPGHAPYVLPRRDLLSSVVS